MDEFETGFYDKEKLEELKKAQKDLLDAFLDTNLGRLVVWCVEGLDRLLTMCAADRGQTARKKDK